MEKTLLAPFTTGNGVYETVFNFSISSNATSYTVKVNRVRLHVDDYDSADNNSRVSINYGVSVNGTSIYQHSQTHVEWWGRRWYEADVSATKTFDKAEGAQTVVVQFSSAAQGNTGYMTYTFSVDPYSDDLLTPKHAVTGLAVTRAGNVYTGKWKVPSDATNSNTRNRFTGLQVRWLLDMASVSDIEDIDAMAANATENSNGYGEWTGNFAPWKGKALSRDAFYPMTAQKLNRVLCAVRGYHKRSNNGKVLYGPWAGSVAYTLNPPRKPSVTWAYDANTSKATVTVKTDEGKDSYERYDTMVKVSIRKQDGKESVLLNWGSTKSTEWKKTVDVSPYITNLTAGKYVTVKCWAYARGLKGDNPAQADAVYAARSIALPAAAAVGAITCDKKAPTGRIKVNVTPGSWTTGVQLQRRAGEDGSWTDVPGSVDNGDAKALYDAYGDADPQPGVYTYYRVKSTRDNYMVYSAAKRADCIYTAKPKIACTATVGIVSVTPATNGQSASVVMGFSDSTANTGCELSWADHANAWASTDGPSAEQITGHDATSKSSKYKYTRTYSIGSLTSGTTYYCRMRRYREHEGDTYYSSYSQAFSFQAESALDDRCGIISVTPSKSGTSAVVVVGYTEDNTNTGTELSWSTVSGAWSSSSEEPETHEYPTAGTASSTKWAKQVSLAITDELEPGSTYYVRARRYLESGGTTTYTPYSAAQKFMTESAEDDTCGIVSVSPATSGEMATVVVGINEDNPNTGTIIEWSTDRYAWQSNQQPESLDATWGRAAYGTGGWTYKQTSYLRGLEAGKTYYIKARRYLTAGSSTTYGPWSKLQSFKTPKATAANDKCAIISVTKAVGGTGAEVLVGWTEDTANDGTELSWSKDKKAWTSNEQPSTMQADWADKTSKDSNWARTQTISLRGLELGTTYFMKARRYLSEGSDGTTYSPYSAMVSLTTPSESKDVDVRCGLVSLEPGADGTSAVAVVGWSGDHTGCELSWSENPDAWFSNEQPQSQTFEWSDEKRKSTAWSHTSTFYISGLEEGVTYYVKARSYHDGDETVWSDYTEDMTVTPYSAPASVLLSAPSAVARGESIELYWTVESDVEQKEWHVHLESQPNKSLVEGSGSLCHASIPASRYGDATSISLYVEAGCGGGLTDSNVVSVGIADRPSCEAACPAVLTAQPASFEVYSDDPHAAILATCRSTGVTMQAPDGDRDQLEGDVVWTDAVVPSWASVDWSETLMYDVLEGAEQDARAAYFEALESDDFELSEDTEWDPAKTYYTLSGGTYMQVVGDGDWNPSAQGWYEGGDSVQSAQAALLDALADLGAHVGDVYATTVTLPTTVDFVDNGGYSFAVQAVEPVAGLGSPVAACLFNVGWEHQAPNPSDGITVEADVDSRSVTITLAEPDGYADGDVYDIYRMNPTGHALVARDLPPDAVVTDPYAPFGESPHYRVCCRTPDGDVAFRDYEYSMPVETLRFDWPRASVELPFNLELSDTYEKDFETRAHVDGSVNGYYDKSVTMTGSYSSDVVKADAATVTALRSLAEHPGAAFCRTTSGMAFQCNVDVSGLDTSYSSHAMPVQLNVTAMKLTQLFFATVEEEV